MSNLTKFPTEVPSSVDARSMGDTFSASLKPNPKAEAVVSKRVYVKVLL